MVEEARESEMSLLKGVTGLGEVDQRVVCLPGSVSALVGTPDYPLSPFA